MNQLPTISKPFPISLISNRYLLFNIDVITYVRREHHICGVLLGSIPQIPQQNVFLGLPLELMPEETRLLVEKGAAFIVGDAKWHLKGLNALGRAEKTGFKDQLGWEGMVAAMAARRRVENRQEKAIQGKASHKQYASMNQEQSQKATEDTSEGLTEGDSLFTNRQDVDSPATAPRISGSAHTGILSYGFTPTTSYPPLPLPPQTSGPASPPTLESYPLYAYLHSQGYYISPGLRFGCQYLVYPGDPLRFHSHFLAVGADWNKETDLLELVGGGRLGTGVKKAYMIGGLEKTHEQESDGEWDDKVVKPVRTFCIEWGGM